LTKSTLVALTKDKVEPFKVNESPDVSPRVELPFTVKSVENLPAPMTSKATPGAVVPIPTREFKVSTLNSCPIRKAVEEESRPKATSPEVEVKLRAPVVKVNPLEAVTSPV